MARFHQKFYVFDDARPVPVVIRGYTEADFDELIAIQSETFPPPYPPEQWWNKEQLMQHVTLFPEGALCVEVDGMLAGSITSLIVDYDPMEPAHSWAEATDNGYIRTHQPDGNTLYIADICVRPRFRKLGLGKWLIQSLYHVTVERGLERLLGGGRMPGYHRCGRTPGGVAAEYLEDEESCNYGALMEWKNPFRE